MQFRFGPVIARAERRLAIALPVAAATPTSAPPPPASFARLLARRAAFMARLRRTEAILFRGAGIVVLVRDGMLGDGVIGEGLLHVLTRFAAAPPAATAAAAPSPSRTFAIGFDGHFIVRSREFRFFGLFAGFSDPFVDFLGRRRDQLRLLGGKVARGLRRVHLFAAIDHI